MSNINMDNNDLAVSILEVKYIKAMGREVSLDFRTNMDLYPTGWFSIGNSVIKMKILAEAIEKKCLIVDTKEYAKIEEGVRTEKKEQDER